MRAAAAYEDGRVFQDFCLSRQFKIYEIFDGKIVAAQVVNTNAAGAEALAGILLRYNVQALLCGDIDEEDEETLDELDISIYGGETGNADEAVCRLLKCVMACKTENCSHDCSTCSSACPEYGQSR